ncbi:MAG: hypothetical protein ACK4J2_08880, partial [Sulfurihydrogenibium azorense]|uniref:hypothetical protein n=1 Tax=Sulfurihydrogenibium azorense TaxID=309806 RepID=UPI00391C5017
FAFIRLKKRINRQIKKINIKKIPSRSLRSKQGLLQAGACRGVTFQAFSVALPPRRQFRFFSSR